MYLPIYIYTHTYIYIYTYIYEYNIYIYIEICISNKYLIRESMSFFSEHPICHGPFTNHPLVQVPLK